jgi:23S rRNA-/tRNA-specific pseudouridylate synthase
MGGLPERRAADLISRAMRAFPMPADPEPPEVVYEDEDIVATNKPPGLNTAPAHR